MDTIATADGDGWFTLSADSGKNPPVEIRGQGALYGRRFRSGWAAASGWSSSPASGLAVSWLRATPAVLASWVSVGTAARAAGGLTQTEIDYLASQPLGRLATVRPDGTLTVEPVFRR